MLKLCTYFCFLYNFIFTYSLYYVSNNVYIIRIVKRKEKYLKLCTYSKYKCYIFLFKKVKLIFLFCVVFTALMYDGTRIWGPAMEKITPSRKRKWFNSLVSQFINKKFWLKSILRCKLLNAIVSPEYTSILNQISCCK